MLVVLLTVALLTLSSAQNLDEEVIYEDFSSIVRGEEKQSQNSEEQSQAPPPKPSTDERDEEDSQQGPPQQADAIDGNLPIMAMETYGNQTGLWVLRVPLLETKKDHHLPNGAVHKDLLNTNQPSNLDVNDESD
ncbi:acidic proline-rich protein PRP33 [Nannospalax galili]|uniref:acidic proline-rich protein PRP33 n=1 Tax=Nannospalax galili TaxID=1026970 RepID=UPI0004ED0FBD|nr:acidic proline-rich protein PRP33 [Nannospalax galili]